MTRKYEVSSKKPVNRESCDTEGTLMVQMLGGFAVSYEKTAGGIRTSAG